MELISVCPRKSGKAWQTGKIVESNIKTWCAVSHAVKHLLVRRKQTHEEAHTCTAQTHRLTHLASQEAMGPMGQSKLESLVHLFTSNYRNTTIFATTASVFFFFLHFLESEPENKEEGEKDRALTAFFSQRWTFGYLIPSALLLSQCSTRRNEKGGGECLVKSLIFM